MVKYTPYFWILFILFSLVHVYFCYKENEKARKISKCFIIPLLLVYMIMISSKNVFVYLGAISGFIGDILIIFKKKKVFFVLGAAFFMLGHLFYIVQIYNVLRGFVWWHIIVFIIIGFLLSIVGYNLVYPKIGKMTIVGVIYFTFLVSMIFIAVSTRRPLIVLGAFTFAISDIILSFVNFFKPTIQKKELYVMSTYILAQTLMILALA